MNNTVIKGTPLQNSINPIDIYLIRGKPDLLPSAKAIPIGKQKIKQKKDIIKVNDKRTVDSNEQVNASHILLTIQPGRGTENELKDTASIFALEATEYGFFALADSLGLEIQDSNGLRKESIFVDNFGVGRSAVNFAFNNVEGSTSDAIKNDNFFGVFFLDKVSKETVISFEEVKEDFDCKVQIRYQSEAVAARVSRSNQSYKIEFNEPQLAVTPGQSAVIYRDDECLGGSIIKDRISKIYYNWAENRGYNYQAYG